MCWLLNISYLLLLTALSPVLLFRMLVRGKYRDGWGEKLLGRLPPRRSHRPCLWFHAVSVGEVLQLQTVLNELAPLLPGHDFVITTTTVTGLAVARDKFGGSRHHVCYFPLDFTWAVQRALNVIRPAAVVLVELELWPNFIAAVHRRRIPLALINGRVSESSFRGYRRIRPLMRRLLERFDLLAVQNDTYGKRLEQLGAPPARVQVTGSIKFDGVDTCRNNPQTAQLRTAFGISESAAVFVAGSTQAPEEQFALAAWQTLRTRFPHLRLILVPRHKERFEEVARLVESQGWPLLRRTDLRPTGTNIVQPESEPVLLLDTLGELGACWGLADVAFVGGSLTRRGGQNMIEPAAYGAAVLFGPNTWNFRDVVDLLLSAGAARVVADENELTAAVGDLLADRQAAQRQGETARQLVLSQQGATTRTAALLVHLIDEAAEPQLRAA